MAQATVRNGMDVLGSEGDKVGTVSEVNPGYFVVQKGFFFPNDYYIPHSAVERVDKKTIHLNVTREEAMDQDPPWSERPSADDVVGSAPSQTAGSVNTAARETGERDERSHDGDMVVDPAPFEHEQDSPRTHVNEDDHLRIDVHEEELIASKRRVDLGDVEIHKDVVVEERHIDVPVTEERVDVTRTSVDRGVTPGDDAFVEGTFEVPVHGEEVEVEKRARVVEELDVDKSAVQGTERVTDTVRRENVTIEGEDGSGTPDHR